MKVKISKVPKYKTGDQVDYALHTGFYDRDTYHSEDDSVPVSQPIVDRNKANIEAENGEIKIEPDLLGVYKINGKTHKKGGSPLRVKPGSYIVSNHLKVDSGIAKALDLKGENMGRKTWADLLKENTDIKRYNKLSKFLKQSEKGELVDQYDLKTAELQIPRMSEILSKIALGNELTKAKKGKEFIIPEVSRQLLGSMIPNSSPEESPDNFVMQSGNQYSASSKVPTSSVFGLQYFNDVSVVNDYNSWRKRVKGSDFGIENSGNDGDFSNLSPVHESLHGTPSMKLYNNTGTIGDGNNGNNRPGQLQPNIFDQMSVFDALSTKVNSYYPWSVKPDVRYLDLEKSNPNYAPILSAQKQRLDTLNAISSPSIARAVSSYQPDTIQGILQESYRTSQMNNQIDNYQNAYNSQLYNSKSSQDAAIDTDNYNKTIMTREQTDIANKLKREDVKRTFKNMMDNITKLNYFSQKYPQFSVSGPFWSDVIFNQGKDGLTDGKDASGPNIINQIKSWFPDQDLTLPQIIEVLKALPASAKG